MNLSGAAKFNSVFFGTPEFALSSLEAALKTTRVLGVVTQPDRPRGRGQKLSPCPVKELAQKNAIPCFSPSSLRKSSPELEELRAWMKNIGRPDFLLVTAYGNLLPQEFLDWPRVGAINVHASLLPRWRGAAPIQRAIEAGDAITGVCLQKMIFELDAGNVLAEAKVDLEQDTNAATLSATLSKVGGELLEKFLNEQNNNTHPDQTPQLTGTPQNPALITFAKKIEKSEAFYSPEEWSSKELLNRTRAFHVWPGVKAELNGQIIKICSARRPSGKENLSAQSFEVGSIIKDGERVLLVTCENIRTREYSFVEIVEIQFPGKPAQKAIDVLRNFFSKNTPLTLKKAAST